MSKEVNKQFDLASMPFAKMFLTACEDESAEEGKKHFFSAALPKDTYTIVLEDGDIPASSNYHDPNRIPVTFVTVYHNLFDKKD